MNRSSGEVKDWFYNLGINKNLPATWIEFKRILIEFRCCLGIEDLYKFKEEKWSQYLMRLSNTAKQYKINEQDVLKKLRNENCSKTLQSIFYSFNVSLDDMLIRIYEYENFLENNINYRTGNESNKKDFKEKNILKQNIKCFKCGKMGHYSNECQSNNGKINNIKKDLLCKNNIDEKKILLNGKKCYAILDTGASNSVITRKALKNIPNLNMQNVKAKFKLIDGRCINVREATELEIGFAGRTYKDLFYIVENNITSNVLIGNEVVKRLNGNQKKIPFQCTINTEGTNPVSWSRPISSNVDKKELNDLVNDLESKGIVEESTSEWLNPIHIVRKKMVNRVFALILGD